MKRPEGFDPVTPTPSRAARPKQRQAAPKPELPKKAPAKKLVVQKVLAQRAAAQTAPARKAAGQKAAAQKAAPAAKEPKSKKPSAASAQREARRAAAQRRRYERDEIRRFTRRSRHRRLAWIVAASTVLALVGVVAIAVYSPLLALTKIEITGTSAVDKAEVLAAVDGQLGTPLALVDTDRLTAELAEFTLIQSYVTEIVPPHTLIIHVTERAPIGSVVTGSGFTVVDAAGVAIERSAARPEGVPLIELAGADIDSDVFDSVVEVLLNLPDSVADRVERVTAATKDNVTLVLDGVGQRVVWGSAEQSELKARVLARLMENQGSKARVEFDVTAPLNVVVRPL